MPNRKKINLDNAINSEKLTKSVKDSKEFSNVEFYPLLGEQQATDYENAIRTVCERFKVQNDSIFTHKASNGNWYVVIFPSYSRILINVGIEYAAIQFNRTFPIIGKAN